MIKHFVLIINFAGGVAVLRLCLEVILEFFLNSYIFNHAFFFFAFILVLKNSMLCSIMVPLLLTGLKHSRKGIIETITY